MVFSLEFPTSVTYPNLTFSTGNVPVVVAAGHAIDIDIAVTAGPAAVGTYEGEIIVVNVGGRGYVASETLTIPTELTIAGDPVPWVTHAGVVFDDDRALAVTNDGDGFVEPGELADLWLSVRSEGNLAVSNLAGTVVYTGTSGAVVVSAEVAFAEVLLVRSLPYQSVVHPNHNGEVILLYAIYDVTLPEGLVPIE